MRAMICAAFLLSGCQHYCENYVDCDAQVKALRQQVAAMREEERHLRVWAADVATERCDIR